MKYILKHLCQVFRAKVNLIMLYVCCHNNILCERPTAILHKSRLARNKQRTFQKFITRHYRLKTQSVPKVYQPVYNMFRFMKIVIKVFFTVYKPEKQVDESTGIKQRSFVVIFRNPSGEELEVPLNHSIPDCNTFWFRPSVSQY